MKLKTIFTDKRFWLKKLALLVIIIGLLNFFSFPLLRSFSHYYDGKAMKIKVERINDLDTRNSLLVGKDSLVYGVSGILYYHPRSFAEAVLYDDFARIGAGYFDCLAIILVGIYLYRISLTITEEAFFTLTTMTKFVHLLTLCFVIIVFKYLSRIGISYLFYNSTDHKFVLQEGLIGLSGEVSTYCMVGVLIIILVGRFFEKATHLQKEQDLTI